MTEFPKLAMAPPDGEPRYMRMRFEQSVRGLAVDAPVEFLGINIGRVVSVRLDYDEKKGRFPVVVGAVVYPQRLGSAYDKLEALAKARGEKAHLAQLMGPLIAHGLRAQARVNNLFESAFPLYANSASGVQPYGDWRSRTYSLSLTASF